jgi:hypothetical protein
VSTNHSEIIVLYETSHELAWLHKMIDHIHIPCGMDAIGSPTIIYEDNAACVAQMQTEYIKTNYTNHRTTIQCPSHDWTPSSHDYHDMMLLDND